MTDLLQRRACLAAEADRLLDQIDRTGNVANHARLERLVLEIDRLDRALAEERRRESPAA